MRRAPGSTWRPFPFPHGLLRLATVGRRAAERPKDAALRRPSPVGIKESGKATFPRGGPAPNSAVSTPLFAAPADPAQN